MHRLESMKGIRRGGEGKREGGQGKCGADLFEDMVQQSIICVVIHRSVLRLEERKKGMNE